MTLATSLIGTRRQPMRQTELEEAQPIQL